MNSEYYSTVKKRGFALNNSKVYNKKPAVPAPASITLSRRFEALREEYSAARKERAGKGRRVDHAVDSDSSKNGQRRFSNNHHIKHGAKSSANSSNVCKVYDKSQVGSNDKPRNGPTDQSQVGPNLTLMQVHKTDNSCKCIPYCKRLTSCKTSGPSKSNHAALGRGKGKSLEWVEIRFRPLSKPHVEKKANLRVKVGHEGGRRSVSEVKRKGKVPVKRREEEGERRRRSRSRRQSKRRGEMVRKSPARRELSPTIRRRSRGPRDRKGRSPSRERKKRRREGEPEEKGEGGKRARREQYQQRSKSAPGKPPASAGGRNGSPRSPSDRKGKITESEMIPQENLRSVAKRKRNIQEDDDGVDEEVKERMENRRNKNKRRRMMKKEKTKTTRAGSSNMCGEPDDSERGKKRKAVGGPGRQSRAKVSRTCQTTERNRRFKPTLDLVNDILVNLIEKAERKAKKKMDGDHWSIDKPGTRPPDVVMEGDEESNTNPHVVMTPEGREGQVADSHLPGTASGPNWEKKNKKTEEKKAEGETKRSDKPRVMCCKLCGQMFELSEDLRKHALCEHLSFIQRRTKKELKLPKDVAEALDYPYADEDELNGEDELSFWKAMQEHDEEDVQFGVDSGGEDDDHHEQQHQLPPDPQVGQSPESIKGPSGTPPMYQYKERSEVVLSAPPRYQYKESAEMYTKMKDTSGVEIFRVSLLSSPEDAMGPELQRISILRSPESVLGLDNTGTGTGEGQVVLDYPSIKREFETQVIEHDQLFVRERYESGQPWDILPEHLDRIRDTYYIDNTNTGFSHYIVMQTVRSGDYSILYRLPYTERCRVYELEEIIENERRDMDRQFASQFASQVAGTGMFEGSPELFPATQEGMWEDCVVTSTQDQEATDAAAALVFDDSESPKMGEDAAASRKKEDEQLENEVENLMVESFSGPVGLQVTPDATMMTAPPGSGPKDGKGEKAKSKKRCRESGTDSSPAKPPTKTSKTSKKSPTLVIKKKTGAQNKVTKKKKANVADSASPSLAERTTGAQGGAKKKNDPKKDSEWTDLDQPSGSETGEDKKVKKSSRSSTSATTSVNNSTSTPQRELKIMASRTACDELVKVNESLHSCKKRCERIREERNKLNRDVEKLKRDQERIRMEVDTLNSEKEELEKREKVLVKQKEDAILVSRAQHHAETDAQGALQVQKDIVKTLKADVTKLEKDLKSAKTSTKTLNSKQSEELKKKNQRIKELELKIKELQTQVMNNSRLIESNERKLREAAIQAKKAADAHEKEVRKLSTSLKSKEDALNKVRDVMKGKTVRDAMERRSSSESSSDEPEITYDAKALGPDKKGGAGPSGPAAKEPKQLKKKSGKDEKDLNKELKELKRQLEMKDEMLREASGENGAATAAMEQYRSERDLAQRNVTRNMDHIHELEKERTELNKKFAMIKRERDQLLRGSNSVFQKEEIERLTREVNRLNGVVDFVHDQWEATKKDKVNLERQLEVSKSKQPCSRSGCNGVYYDDKDGRERKCPYGHAKKEKDKFSSEDVRMKKGDYCVYCPHCNPARRVVEKEENEDDDESGGGRGRERERRVISRLGESRGGRSTSSVVRGSVSTSDNGNGTMTTTQRNQPTLTLRLRSGRTVDLQNSGSSGSGPSGSGSSSSGSTNKTPTNAKKGVVCKYLEAKGNCTGKACRFDHPSHLFRVTRESQGDDEVFQRDEEREREREMRTIRRTVDNPSRSSQSRARQVSISRDSRTRRISTDEDGMDREARSGDNRRRESNSTPANNKRGGATSGDTDMSEVEVTRPKISSKGNSTRDSGNVVQRSPERSPVRRSRTDQRREIHESGQNTESKADITKRLMSMVGANKSSRGSRTSNRSPTRDSSREGSRSVSHQRSGSERRRSPSSASSRNLSPRRRDTNLIRNVSTSRESSRTRMRERDSSQSAQEEKRSWREERDKTKKKKGGEEETRTKSWNTLRPRDYPSPPPRRRTRSRSPRSRSRSRVRSRDQSQAKRKGGRN